MPDVHAALQAAATALLPTASEPMLRQILRDLLADDDPTPVNALGTVQAANALARTAPGAESPGQALARPHKLAQPPRNGQDLAQNSRDAPGNGPDPTGSAHHPAFRASADPLAEWPTVRHQIRAAMTERGVDFEQLGERLGYVPATLQQAIGTNKPKTRRMVERLAAWLADPDAVVVVAVAAEAPAETRQPFRAGAGRAGPRGGNGQHAHR